MSQPRQPGEQSTRRPIDDAPAVPVQDPKPAKPANPKE